MELYITYKQLHRLPVIGAIHICSDTQLTAICFQYKAQTVSFKGGGLIFDRIKRHWMSTKVHEGLGRSGGTAVGAEVLPDSHFQPVLGHPSLPGSREPGYSSPGVCNGL